MSIHKLRRNSFCIRIACVSFFEVIRSLFKEQLFQSCQTVWRAKSRNLYPASCAGGVASSSKLASFLHFNCAVFVRLYNTILFFQISHNFDGNLFNIFLQNTERFLIKSSFDRYTSHHPLITLYQKTNFYNHNFHPIFRSYLNIFKQVLP